MTREGNGRQLTSNLVLLEQGSVHTAGKAMRILSLFSVVVFVGLQKCLKSLKRMVRDTGFRRGILGQKGSVSVLVVSVV